MYQLLRLSFSWLVFPYFLTYSFPASFHPFSLKTPIFAAQTQILTSTQTLHFSNVRLFCHLMISLKNKHVTCTLKTQYEPFSIPKKSVKKIQKLTLAEQALLANTWICLRNGSRNNRRLNDGINNKGSVIFFVIVIGHHWYRSRRFFIWIQCLF